MSETPISPDQRDRLVALMRATKAELWRLLEAAGANSISEMSSRQYIHAISWLQRLRGEQAARGSPPVGA
jgi:hypothetical protein